MGYKCPLCLKDLTGDEKLSRFCIQHGTSEEFIFAESREKMFCPEPDGSCNDLIETGVFLRHLGCPAENPFWDQTSKRVQIATDNSSTIRHTITTANGPQDVQVTHWEIAMLQSVPTDAKEMWFPLMLLRATAEERNGKRIGALVELAGAREVGKTVLALQAMDYQGYIPLGGSGHIGVKDYIFSRRLEGGTGNPLLDKLYLRHLMETNKAFVIPQGTIRGAHDLKVVFITPSAYSKPEGRDRQVEPSESAGAHGWLNKIANSIKHDWHLLKEDLKRLLLPVYQPGAERSFRYTVAFYDTAGEEAEKEDLILQRLEHAVDRVAVLIAADDIFQASSGQSLQVALQRINRLSDQKLLNRCLVVTKVDCIMNQLPPEEKEKVRRIAGDLEQNPEQDEEAHNLLIGWLKQKGHQELANKLAEFKVFFVWTEGLPEAGEGEGVVPYSWGLAKFICWCLGITWPMINLKSRI